MRSEILGFGVQATSIHYYSSTSGVCLDFLRVSFFDSRLTLRVAGGCKSDTTRADIYQFG